MKVRRNTGIFTSYLEKQISLLQQKNQQLKEQNEFLIKRENKLQQIEMMFKNRSVDLEEFNASEIKIIKQASDANTNDDIEELKKLED